MTRPLPLVQRCLAACALVVAAWIVAAPAVGYAAAGWRYDSRCCCPDPTDCHCPGHDDRGDSDSLEPCSNSGHVLTADVLGFVVPAPPAPGVVPTAFVRLPALVLLAPPERFVHPITPPS